MPKEARKTKKGWARLSAFELGQIKAHAYHGLTATQIRPLVKKLDGARPSVQGVVDALAKMKDDPKWRGERAAGSGRKRKTSKALDGKIVKRVLKDRGQAKVTVPYLKKVMPELRSFGNSLVQSRLGEAGYGKLKRRRKYLVTAAYVQPRLDFAAIVKRMHASTLERWAYTDGTVFFRDRDAAENEMGKRLALGQEVWRQIDGSDALFADCVGPSSYKKAQGPQLLLSVSIYPWLE
jgi:hypothetical protein